MKILITENQLKQLIDNKIKLNGIFISKNIDDIDGNKNIGNELLVKECKKYNTPEELLRNGGFSDFALDLAAFGFTEESVKVLSPKNLRIKWKDDLDNVYYEINHSKLSPLEWSKKINLSEPVDVSFDGNKFYLEDGHHRYFAAKTLKKKLNVKLEINANPIKPLSNKGYDQFHIDFFNQCKNTLTEQSRHDYLKWKRKNVTLRGMTELGKENKGGGRFGSGLYTAFLSNKDMAKVYGKVYFVLNAIPKTPKVLQDANLAEIYLQGIINNWCKSRGMSYNSNEFFKHTDIRTEMLNLGYDGLVIKGREMVNYTPPDNVKYFEHEFQLGNYYHQLPNQLNENTNIKNEIIFIRTKKFNNEETINKLPYDGIQCWCIFKNDFDKYITELELWGGNKKDVEIIPSDGFNIFALYYPLAHKYVMGETDKVPELEPFNVHKHRMKFIKQGEKSMLDYVADMKYQILLTNKI